MYINFVMKNKVILIASEQNSSPSVFLYIFANGLVDILACVFKLSCR